MIGTPLPLYQQLLLDLIAPPVLAGIWWFVSEGKTRALGINDQPEISFRHKWGVIILLIALWILMFGTTFYYRLQR